MGVVPKDKAKEGKHLSNLFFIYGIDYAASAYVYEKIKEVISSGINSIPDVELSETNELGRVYRVDPLGITYLRIRGMWGIENPAKVFSYVYTPENKGKFELMTIINNEKYSCFPPEDRKQLETMAKSNPNLKISNIEVKTPDNPSVLQNAKLITFWR